MSALRPWRVMDRREEFIVWANGPQALALEIRRKYAHWISRPFEVRVDLDDNLWPTGTGVVMEDDTWHVIASFRIRCAVTAPGHAA